MNALLGLVRFDGGPVARADLGAMATAMKQWGYEAGEPWLGKSAAIAGDHASLAGGSVVVFAAGRVDNRDELCSALGLDEAQRRSISAAELMATAYERWGADCARRIFGDWSFAAYHPTERRLVLARDHYGQTGLYYRNDGGTLVFASSLKALLVLDHPLHINELQLARHLVWWPGEGAATLYDGILRLPPAHVLTADPTSLRTREYWHPRDAPEVRLRNDDEYVERFIELFTQAVSARLPQTGVVASTQSAGLDSSAVTGLAAAEQSARGERVTALTSVPAYPSSVPDLPDRIADEWPLASLALRGRSNVDHVRIDGAAITPLQAIARSHEIHEEPEFAVANLPWIWAILETCRERRERVLLTGQMGNAGVSWYGDEEVALGRLRQGDALGALRAFRERRAGPGGTWALALRRELAGPARRRLVRAVTRWSERRERESLNSLIHPAFARRLDLEARMRDTGFDPTFARATAADRRLATLLPGAHSVGAQWAEKARAYGLEVLDPTADARLLGFCFGVPNDQFVRGDQDRWLMRRALRGVVPDEVRLNRWRGLQGADVAARLRADGPAVTAALESVVRSEAVREQMDTESLCASWERLRRGPSATARVEETTFVRGLGIALFLRRFEQPQTGSASG